MPLFYQQNHGTFNGAMIDNLSKTLFFVLHFKRNCGIDKTSGCISKKTNFFQTVSIKITQWSMKLSDQAVYFKTFCRVIGLVLEHFSGFGLDRVFSFPPNQLEIVDALMLRENHGKYFSIAKASTS